MRGIALGIFGLIVAVLLVQTLHKASRSGGYDFSSYLLSARALWHGENPYATDTPFPYIYPLTLAFVLGPLTTLPPRLADVVWFALNLGAIVWAVRILLELNASRLGVRWGWGTLLVPLVFLFLLLLAPIQNNLLNGQVNLGVILLCALFLRAYLRGSCLAATALLGFAAAIKLVPLIFLLFLLVRRDFRAFGFTLIWTVFFCLLPVVAAGSNWSSLLSWYWNYFHAILLERATGAGAYSVYFTPAGFLTALAPGLAGHLWVAALSAFLVISALLLLDRDLGRSGRNAWNFNLYLLAILLLSPMAERHHLVYLVPPAILTTLSIWLTSRWRTRRATIAAVVFWVLLFAGGADKYGPYYFLAVVVLFGLTAWLGSDRHARLAEA